MIKFVLKVAIGFVLAFSVQALLRSGFHQLVGRGMLDAAGWTGGVRPPNDYMVVTVIAALLACVVAGVVAALVAGKARYRVAIAYGALFTGLTAWASRATLFDSPHPYEWPLILAALVAMPIGAWVVVTLKPLQQVGDAASAGS